MKTQRTGKLHIHVLAAVLMLAASVIACQLTEDGSDQPDDRTREPQATATPLPSSPNQPGEIDSDEPVYIIGDITYSSPFFLNTISEPFVLLEDQIGFIERDLEREFSLEGQVIGPVLIDEDLELSYGLALPSVPQGTFVDVDNDGVDDTGVQIFAVAYWSNTWGDPFLERRDGTGWSSAYASTLTDPESDHEIIGGRLVVWSPDSDQGFPSDFGPDGLLFTEDDPTTAIPAGYTVIDLDQQPFAFHKEARPYLTLIEGDLAVNDYSSETYLDAFNEMFDKASTEYPFTDEKNINWEDIYQEYSGRVENSRSDNDFYRTMRDFTNEFPDGHVGLTFNPQVFLEEQGGGFGMNLAELSDGRIIVTDVHQGGAADEAGIKIGAEIISWDGQPVSEALDSVTPFFGPYSTEHAERIAQVDFLTRVPPDTRIEISYTNRNGSEITTQELRAEIEYESIFRTIPSLNQDQLALPIEAEVLDDSQLGYIRVISFNDDYHLMANLWETHIQALIDNEIPALILDLRSNSGGSSSLAYDFAGYVFDEEIYLYESSYYNDNSKQFEPTGYPARVTPGPLLYEGPIAVLVGPDCVSACEGFADALSRNDRAVVIGHYPTAGAFGEVGRGQYDMPGEISMQLPTGRPVKADGELHIEGTGVIPDILVPVTIESATGQVDAVLQTAIDTLLDMVN